MIFMSLSVWQLKRADYKNQRSQLIEQQKVLPAMMINGETITWPESRFRAAEVTGTFETADQILLDNIIQSGKAGYYVMTPLKIKQSEQRILINRGWVAAGNDRTKLPSVPTPDNEVVITGKLDNPRSTPFMFGDGYKPDFEGNQRWSHVDVSYMSEKLDYSILPYILLQTAPKEAGISQKWPANVNKSGMHLGYSIQWAAFALIAFIAFIVINTKKIKREN